MPHSSVAEIRIQVSSPQSRFPFCCCLSSMCVSTEWSAPGENVGSNLQQGHGAQQPSCLGLPDRNSRSACGRAPGKDQQVPSCEGGSWARHSAASAKGLGGRRKGRVLISQGCSLNVSTAHRARESPAKPDPAVKTAPLHQTQLLPRSSGGLRAEG